MNGSANNTRAPDLALSDTAKKPRQERHLRRDAAGNVVERPAEMFQRAARAVAAAKSAYGSDPASVAEEFFRAMVNLDFLPNSPVLMNAGASNAQYPACFVLPVEDSMASIMATAKNAALIQKEGGGTGFACSRLRPEGSPVRGTAGTASGPASFVEMYNAVGEAVKESRQ